MLGEAYSCKFDAESGIRLPPVVSNTSSSTSKGSVAAGKLIGSRLSVEFIDKCGLDPPSFWP